MRRAGRGEVTAIDPYIRDDAILRRQYRGAEQVDLSLFQRCPRFENADVFLAKVAQILYGLLEIRLCRSKLCLGYGKSCLGRLQSSYRDRTRVLLPDVAHPFRVLPGP